MSRSTLLVLAKAPEAGLVKTRLCPPASPQQAADIAAAALLDTVHAARAVSTAIIVVAISGRLSRASRSAELRAATRGLAMLTQRGDTLGERIAAAHLDAARLRPGAPSLQIGMDTPQVSAELLAAALRRLAVSGTDAVLGPAPDGGWWALGLREPCAAALIARVETSRPDTGERTLTALRAAGLRVALLPELADVDTAVDAAAVAAAAPTTRFADAVRAAGLLGRHAASGAAR